MFGFYKIEGPVFLFSMCYNILMNNYAFIDGNNLHLGAKGQQIDLDYGRFRLYLRNALNVKQAFLFIGYVPTNTKLYKQLQSFGFTLVFKPTVPYMENGKKQTKGNVDAELVLHSAAVEYSHYDKAVIISGDGDFACLLEFLVENDKLEKIITPTEKYSKLLKPYEKFILPLKNIAKSVAVPKHKKTK